MNETAEHGLDEEKRETRESAQEECRRQDVEYALQDRESDALEQENPHYHRDEPSENS